MKRIPNTLAIVLVAMLAACASGKPVVQTDQAAGVDLTHYRTYTWVEEPQTQSPIVRDKLVRAIDAQLAAKGMQRVADGEIALVGHLETREDVSYNHFSLGFGLGGWGNNGGAGVGTSTGTSVPKTNLVGTLVLDMYDAKTKRALWRATANGDVPQTPEAMDAAIGQYVTKMFEKFPSR